MPLADSHRNPDPRSSSLQGEQVHYHAPDFPMAKLDYESRLLPASPHRHTLRTAALVVFLLICLAPIWLAVLMLLMGLIFR
jgi:hypothetical protein